MTATYPDAFRPNLAKCLSNLSVRFVDLGRQEEGLATIEEAVTIGRALAAASPDAFRPDLAGFLNNLSNCFFDLGRRDDGLAAIEEAVATLREPFLAQPMPFKQQMTLMTLTYSEICNYVGLEKSNSALWAPILETLQRLEDESIE